MQEPPGHNTRVTGVTADVLKDSTQQFTPVNLAQLIATARANLPDDIERLLLTAQVNNTQPTPTDGAQYLLFSCAGVECAVPLHALREALPTLPRVVPLPYSPEWMLGMFPLRAEMLGLVDPAPMLVGTSSALHERSLPSGTMSPTPIAPSTALVLGSGERSLAWAVAQIGAIVPIHDEEIRRQQAQAMSDEVPQVVERYNAGRYTMPESDQPITLVRADLLLEDLFTALEESDESHE